jgi:hypothetical protein
LAADPLLDVLDVDAAVRVLGNTRVPIKVGFFLRPKSHWRVQTTLARANHTGACKSHWRVQITLQHNGAGGEPTSLAYWSVLMT